MVIMIIIIIIMMMIMIVIVKNNSNSNNNSNSTAKKSLKYFNIHLLPSCTVCYAFLFLKGQRDFMKIAKI